MPYPSRPPLRREATLSGAKESWGVARGDRKPWCPIPFCPSPREGRVLHAAACKSPPCRRAAATPLAPGGARPARRSVQISPCRRAAATPSPREGHVPARRSVRNSLPPKAAITIPPRAGFRLRRRTAVSAEPLPSADSHDCIGGLLMVTIIPTSPRRPGSTRPSPDGRCAPPAFSSACRPQAASPSCPRRRRDTRARHSRGSFRR